MNKLEPIDDGVRRYRPGLLVMLGIPAILTATWIIVATVREKQAASPPEEPTASIENQVVEIREAPKPEPPASHPLLGKRRLFLADGCLYRYQELTFTRYFSTQHDHPGIVVRDNDPTLWNFVPVPEKDHVYKIYCADPNLPELHKCNLTYTRLVDDREYLDAQPPYLTLRSDDPCEWKILPYKPETHRNQYAIFCLSGGRLLRTEAGLFSDEEEREKSLGWMTGQEDLQQDYVSATLGENGRPSWWILPGDETPKLPRRVSHVLVMNKGEIESLEDAREDFAEEGHEIFRVDFETGEDDFERTARALNYIELVKSLRGTDPVVTHPDFPPIIGLDPGDLLNREIDLKRPDPLFPLIVPLKVKLYAHEIRELGFENTEFLSSNFEYWEELKDFQSCLDESDAADGRIYHGKLFTYIFVSWDQ
jgi:hypothetical protein